MLWKLDDGWPSPHVHIPVLGLVFGSVLRCFLKYRARGLLRFPSLKGKFVGEDQRELRAFQRTRNGSSTDLLPIAACFFVAHEEILIIDAGQMKRQSAASHVSHPHQTGVTERSIRGDE